MSGAPSHDCSVNAHDNFLMFVVRKPDAVPAIYIDPDVSKEAAIKLLQMMTDSLGKLVAEEAVELRQIVIGP